MSLFHIDLPALVKTLGYAGLFAVVFAESGLFFGFFFPGDSLLFAAGLLASQGIFEVWLLAIILALAAIFGDSVGYWFGKKVGPAIFSREDSYFFHKKHIERTKNFYEKYGSQRKRYCESDGRAMGCREMKSFFWIPTSGFGFSTEMFG